MFKSILKDRLNIEYDDELEIENESYEDLEEKYNSLKYIVEQINEGISAIDKNGVIILWNKFMGDRYNLPANVVLGKKMSDFFEDTISERVLNTRVAMSDFFYNKKYDEEGRDLFGYVYAHPVYYNEEFLGVICTEVDISDASKLSEELKKTHEKIKYLEGEVRSLSFNDFDQILGKSRPIEKAKDIAKKVAKSNSSIMLNGETGTGKELFARAIHEYSGRKGTFVPVNCSAIPQELFEEEFFGLAPGVNRNMAKGGKSGIFELVNEGTIFLDEVSELSLNMQAKLLRVLQEREFSRVGSSTNINLDVRVVSASNKDLLELVERGEFREDLFYRLNVVEILLPPIRERKEDIGILIYHFLEQICKENNKVFMKLSKDAFKVLEQYEWKGNIRELKNTIESMVVLSSKGTIDIDDIPDYVIDSVKRERNITVYPMDLNEAIKILEIKKIEEALVLSKGNKSKAAKILNIPRTTLYYKLEQYDLGKNY